MISTARRAEITQQVFDVLDDNQDVVLGLPVDPILIARKADIEVKSWKPDKEGVSGVLMKVGERFLIAHSEAIDNQGFINFTVGHELGHYYLGGHVEAILGSGAHYSRSGFVSQDPFEREADCFAAELLMPRGWFLSAMTNAGEGFRAIEKLASLCKTSIVATAIRYSELTDAPMAVIISTGRSVDYCFMSGSLREYRMKWLERGALVPKFTATEAFNRDAENIRHGRRRELESSLSSWFEGAPKMEMKEDVVGLGHYGKTLTVLFADEGADQDDEDQDESDNAYNNLPSVRWQRRSW